MKSVIQEGSSLAKAIEQGWIKAGKPKEFTIKIFQEAKKNFFGWTTIPAKVGIFFKDFFTQEHKEIKHGAPRPQQHREKREQRPEQRDQRDQRDQREQRDYRQQPPRRKFPKRADDKSAQPHDAQQSRPARPQHPQARQDQQHKPYRNPQPQHNQPRPHHPNQEKTRDDKPDNDDR